MTLSDVKTYTSLAVLLLVAVLLSIIVARPTLMGASITGSAVSDGNLFITLDLPETIEMRGAETAHHKITLQTNLPPHLIKFNTDREWAAVTPDGYLIIDDRAEDKQKVRVVAAYVHDNTIYDLGETTVRR